MMPKSHAVPSRTAMLVAAVALALSVPVFAQSGTSQTGSNSMQPGATGSTGPNVQRGAASNTNSKVAPANPNTTQQPSSTASKGTTGAAAQRGSADNTNARVSPASPAADIDSWASTQATSNKGRVSRSAYMNEMGRRWDSQDKNKQGLTPAEVSRITGKTDVDSSIPPRTASDVAPGNMGPGSTKAQ